MGRSVLTKVSRAAMLGLVFGSIHGNLFSFSTSGTHLESTTRKKPRRKIHYLFHNPIVGRFFPKKDK